MEAGRIRTFADTVNGSADVVETLGRNTPRFEGWNLAPLAGVPLVGLLFVNRCNVIADTWADCTGVLSEVLRGDGSKLHRAADNYIAAEQASTLRIS